MSKLKPEKGGHRHHQRPRPRPRLSWGRPRGRRESLPRLGSHVEKQTQEGTGSHGPTPTPPTSTLRTEKTPNTRRNEDRGAPEPELGPALGSPQRHLAQGHLPDQDMWLPRHTPTVPPQFPLRATLRPQGHGAQSPPTQGLGFREGKEGTHDPSGACPGGPKPLERAEETLGALLQPAAQPRGLRAGADVEGWLTPLHPLCSSD